MVATTECIRGNFGVSVELEIGLIFCIDFSNFSFGTGDQPFLLTHRVVCGLVVRIDLLG